MNWQRGYKILFTLLISGFAAIPAQAQMKLGGQAGATRLDAVLELGTQRKGLLLPRVTNAALASNPLDSAAQGMMVFNIDDQTLYIKKTNGYTTWNKLLDLSTFALANMSDVNYPTLPAIDQLLRYNGTKWSNWTPDYIKTISGDVTAGAVNAAGNVVTTLSDFGAAGIYYKTTVDAKGRVQSGETALVAADIPSLAASYIQNQNAVLQTGDFHIGGNGNMGSLTVTNNGALGSLNVTNNGSMGSLNVTGLTTNGAILFTNGAGLVSQKAGQLIWDNTNNRLGIGLASPNANLDVQGDFKLGSSGTILTNIIKTSFTMPATSIAVNGTSQVTITLPAGIVLNINDNLIINPTGAMPTAVAIGYSRVSNVAARQIIVALVNATNTAKNTVSQTYNLTIIQ